MFVMSDKHDLLTRLQETIDRYHQSHGADDDLLAIRAEVVKRAGEDEHADDGFIDRIGAAIEKFETDHLELTESLNQVAYFLSGEGL